MFRLLTNGLNDLPNNDRYTFYLANSIVGDIIPIRQNMKPSSSGRVMTEFILRDQKMELQMKILQP